MTEPSSDAATARSEGAAPSAAATLDPASDARAPVVVLVSGGLDSATVLAIASRSGRPVYALSVDYGQRHRVELEAARALAQHFGVVEHAVVDLAGLGALTRHATSLIAGSTRAVAARAGFGDGESPPRPAGAEAVDDVPSTYVPARNTVMLALALAWAESIGARAIALGVNAVDYSGYPDCRPDFLAAFSEVSRLGTARGREGAAIAVEAPLQHATKAEIIAQAAALGVPLARTVSCYDARATATGVVACGRCESCILRRSGFAAAGVPDPTAYAEDAPTAGAVGSVAP